MIAKNVAFICGSVLAVTIILTVWDEDVLNVEHVSDDYFSSIIILFECTLTFKIRVYL